MLRDSPLNLVYVRLKGLEAQQYSAFPSPPVDVVLPSNGNSRIDHHSSRQSIRTRLPTRRSIYIQFPRLGINSSIFVHHRSVRFPLTTRAPWTVKDWGIICASAPLHSRNQTNQRQTGLDQRQRCPRCRPKRQTTADTFFSALYLQDWASPHAEIGEVASNRRYTQPLSPSITAALRSE